MVLFSILGPLEIYSEKTGTTSPGEGSFQDTLLITLLSARGRVFPAGVLIDELWGQAPPSNPVNALQAHISRLRRKLRGLEPDRPHGRLALMPLSGYRLDVLDEEVDAQLFLAEAAALEREAGTLPPEQVVARVGQALRRWRGPALGGIVGGPICQESARLYEQARLRVLEIRFDAELALGRHGAIIGELTELVIARSSFRERYCEQLMTALYRSGRQAEALEIYRHAREQVGEAAGTGPSRALRDHERAVLEHDSILEAPDTGTVRTLAGSRRRTAAAAAPGHRPSEGGRSFARL
ncbi:BTAD domain-containing putative transcriptional regulator [Streptomyces polygonati]|uniref:BTAD domain-containing putative transcriptional regulator n=1 Tax=Streptomyces polygonati TaxID=1617087 RepID=A0ABV8HKN4_9ACTN